MAAVLVALETFKPSRVDLLGRPMNRLRAGPLEFEPDRLLATVEADINPVERAVPGESVAVELAGIAEQSPLAAIMESFERVEKSLRDLVIAAGVDVSRQSVPALVREALARDLISPETASAIEAVTGTIRLPYARRPDPRPGRERFFRHERGIWVLVVVEFGAVPAILVTVFSADHQAI